LNNKEVVTRL